jgi:lipopolysaccharide export system protein LptA
MLVGVSGQAAEPQLPLTLDAASSEFDRRKEQLEFRDVRIEQGTMSISARLATSKELDFAAGRWTFSGDVQIHTDMGDLQADEAVLSFVDHQLTRAIVTGEPARFTRQMATDEGRLVTGTAREIDYDTGEGEIVLAGNASLMDGLREVRGGRLMYRLAEDRLIASSGEGGQERVHIVIAPPGKEELRSAPDDAGRETPEEPDDETPEEPDDGTPDEVRDPGE